MLNKKLLTISLAAAAACGHVAAQESTVTVYGVVDAAVEHLNNAPSGGITRMPGLSGSVPSRLGFRGNEDLGGGLRGVFTMEMGLGTDSGTLNQGGRAFGRQSYVGIGNATGTFTLGRQYTMLFWSLLDADILGPNLYGSGSMDSYLPNARTDNSMAYRGSMNGFTVGATYSFGRDVVNAGPSPSGTNCAGESATDKSACREWSAMLKYDAPQWGAALATDTIRGGTGAFAGLTSSALKDTRTTVNGYGKLGAWKIGGGVLSRNNNASATTPRSDLWFMSASYAATPLLVLDGGYFDLKYKNSPNKASLVALRATYSLSKRTATYVSLGNISNAGALALSVSNGQAGGAPNAGSGQTGIAVGIRHSF